MIKVVSAFLLIFPFSGSTSGVAIQSCAKGTLPQSVKIQNCTSDEWICKVHYYSVLELQMTFDSPCYLENITPRVVAYSIFGNMNFTITEEQKNACWGVQNTLCPLVASENIIYTFKTNFEAPPLVPLILQFDLVDMDQNDSVVCFKANLFPVINVGQI